MLDHDERVADVEQRFALDVERGEVHAAGNDFSGALDMRIRHEQDGGSEAQGTLRGSGELAADGIARRTAQQGQGAALGTEMVQGQADVQHLARGAPVRLPRPVHFAGLEAVEAQDLLPGRRGAR